MNKKNKIKDNSYVNDVVDKLECIAEIAVLSVIYFYFWRFQYDAALFPPLQHREICCRCICTSVDYRICVDGRFSLGIFEAAGRGHFPRRFYFRGQFHFILAAVADWKRNDSGNADGDADRSADADINSRLFLIYEKIYFHLHSKKNMVMIYGTENALKLQFKANNRLSQYHVSKAISADTDFIDILSEINRYDGVIINVFRERK